MSITVCRNRDQIPPGFYLADCAVSGGTLEAFLRACMELTKGQLCVRIAPIAMDFPLPCPGGKGTPISQDKLEQLKKTHACHFSSALQMNYLTYMDGPQLHGVLFDTKETLRKKLNLAERLGVPMALLPDSNR